MDYTQTKQNGRDPVLKLGLALKNHPVLRLVLAISAGLMSLTYLTWRVIYTQGDVNPILFWALWSAEFIGACSMWLFLRDTRHVKSRPKAFEKTERLVDILIPTYDEAKDILEPTLVGATKVFGNTEIWVLDDGRRDWVKKLCKKYGLNYVTRDNNLHAKAGNINNVLPELQGEYLLVLDADHVPFPAIVEKLIGYFIDDKVAVVQTPHNFRNRDSVQHYDHDIHEQSLFFEILLPGREAAEAVFWCGSGAMLRTSALREVGGVATETITEDLETSIKFERAGYKMYLHNEILLHGLAPHDLASYLIQRYRWARGTLQVLLGSGSPIFGLGFKLKTRVSYLSNLVYYLLPIQQILYISVLCFTLATGQVPLRFDYFGLLLIWVPQMALSMASSWLLSNGRQRPLQGTINTWTTSGIYIQALIDTLLRRKTKFSVTPKEGVDLGGAEAARQLMVPIAALGALTVAMLLRGLDDVFALGLLGAMPPSAQALSYGFAIFETYILIRMLRHFLRRRQRRISWRYVTHNICTIDGFPGVVKDLSLYGLSARIPDERRAFARGERLPVSLQLEHLDGEKFWIHTHLGIKRVDPQEKYVDLFGELEWVHEKDRQAVLEYCNLVLAQREVHYE